ncbi:MAG: PEP-CTERM sorting domain-containing protein [Candidatus Omnitrophica bacterium]|nr:PEP-CTERM sorting domain-containing protein [Candidatus Omnitrophota bacterium]MBI3010344.1 PEP-CTERM sorting domain-containing protein [Candidatus Omnitrophota bacterium]
MMWRLRRAGTIVAIVLSVMAALGAPGASADDTDGDLFYTTFAGFDRVFKRPYSFTGGVLAYGLETPISNLGLGLGGADGLVFDPTDTNFLLVGGQNDRVYRVHVPTGIASASSPLGASSFHLSIDPSGSSVWASGIPGNPIANVSLTPFNSATSSLPIIGDVSAITGLAFDASGDAYYTSSGPGGTGSFGTIDLSTGTTAELFGAVPAAHGLAYDSFTGDFMLFGDGQVSQYDPGSNSFVSTMLFPGEQFDQGSVDGAGHLFGASNLGNMLFVDYKATGLINDGSNFSDLQFFRDSLDDVAPLSGLGSQQPVIPEPSSLLLMGLGGLGVGIRNRRRKVA